MATDRPSLTLRPFRGLRFAGAAVGDLGTVVSPPYDVLDADTVRELEAANRHNIVRLILSRRYEQPYLAVRDRLRSWQETGILRPDDSPGLYVYEYTVGDATVRGLVGLLGLRTEDQGVVLPHEDVMPGPVDDRAALMRATQTNLEPILLVHEGTDRLRDLIASAAAHDPVASFTAIDESRHRVWAVTDESALAGIAEELAPSTALIADGHHRYAAYLRLQGELRDELAPPGTSPWDHGLALLVDQADHALDVGPIHRSVGDLTMADLEDSCTAQELRRMPDREAAFAARVEASDLDHSAFVVSDGRSWAVLRVRRTAPVDAAVLHEHLLPAWGVAEEQVGYHHSLDQALQTTARQPGLVIAVTPPTLREVMDVAARGIRMPRKSTSFAPKPSMGVVMRDLQAT